MLDDFRQQAADSFADQEDEFRPPVPARPTKFLGMTPAQMFIVSVLLLVLTCVLSAFCLLATGRVVPPNIGSVSSYLSALGIGLAGVL